MIPCKECNGQGLVSTGANKLDLTVGSKVTCAECGGTGQVADPNAEQAQQEGPKAQDPSQSAPGGGEPSDSGEPIGPKEGDPCVDANGVSGYLGQDGDGKWVCIVG